MIRDRRLGQVSNCVNAGVRQIGPHLDRGLFNIDLLPEIPVAVILHGEFTAADRLPKVRIRIIRIAQIDPAAIISKVAVYCRSSALVRVVAGIHLHKIAVMQRFPTVGRGVVIHVDGFADVFIDVALPDAVFDLDTIPVGQLGRFIGSRVVRLVDGIIQYQLPADHIVRKRDPDRDANTGSANADCGGCGYHRCPKGGHGHRKRGVVHPGDRVRVAGDPVRDRPLLALGAEGDRQFPGIDDAVIRQKGG